MHGDARSSGLLTVVTLLAALAAAAAPVRAQTAEEHPAAEHAAPGAAAATHDAGHGAINYDEPPINPTPAMLQLFVFSLVLFGLFLLVSRSMIWKPLIQALDEREGRINVAHAEAERANAEAAKLLAMHQARMNELEEQVKAIVAKARQQADAEKAQIIASAEAEANALRGRALTDIRNAREEAMSGLSATVERQVGLASEHILGHRLN
jgi:F-type H+-transporting ATPase subunit b